MIEKMRRDSRKLRREPYCLLAAKVMVLFFVLF